METVLENDRRIRQWEKVERNMESTDTPRADLGRFSQRARRGCPGRGAAPAGEGAPGSAGTQGDLAALPKSGLAAGVRGRGREICEG